MPPVGAWAEVDHVFSQEAVNSFAAICGDDNPLHTDPEWAKVRAVSALAFAYTVIVIRV